MADRTRRGPAGGDRPGKPSITSHPLFPPIVVLWVGALFGLASIAVHPSTIESLVVATGIDRVIPMAAPPLGNTFRILLALMMTGLGCIVGLLVARRLAKPAAQHVAARRRTREARDPAPVTLPDEQRDDEPAAPSGRRRSLTSMDATPPAEDRVPLPGAPHILSVNDLDLDGFEDEREPQAWNVDLLNPDDTLPVAAVGHDDHDSPDGIFDRPLARSNEEDEPEAPARRNRLFDAYVRNRRSEPAPAETEVPQPGFTLLPDMAAHEDMAWEETRNEAADQPLESPAEIASAWIEPEAAAAETHESESAAPTEPAFSTAAERITTAPLSDLSHVELLERLALALAKRRAEAAVAVKAAVAAHEPEEAVEAPIPASLRPVRLELATSESEPLPGYVPPRRMGLQEDVSGEDEVLEQGYSSLLGLTRNEAATPAPARTISSDPVIAFPTPVSSEAAQPDPEASGAPKRAFDAPAQGRDGDDTERALRAALETLQRMSGAA